MFPPLSLLAGMYLTDCEELGHISKTLIFSHLFFSLLTAGAIALAPINPDGGPIIRWLIVFFMVLAAVLAALGLKRGRFRAFMMTQARRHCGEACQHRPGSFHPPLCRHLLPSFHGFLHRHLRKGAA